MKYIKEFEKKLKSKYKVDDFIFLNDRFRVLPYGKILGVYSKWIVVQCFSNKNNHPVQIVIANENDLVRLLTLDEIKKYEELLLSRPIYKVGDYVELDRDVCNLLETSDGIVKINRVEKNREDTNIYYVNFLNAKIEDEVFDYQIKRELEDWEIAARNYNL